MDGAWDLGVGHILAASRHSFRGRFSGRRKFNWAAKSLGHFSLVNRSLWADCGFAGGLYDATELGQPTEARIATSGSPPVVPFRLYLYDRRF